MNIEDIILKKLNNEIKELSEIVNLNGGRMFVVGGFLRDTVLNIESKDIDVEIIGMNFEEVLKIVEKRGRAKIVGSSFPIILYENIEIAVTDLEFRGEESIKKASYRRDFTINSLYFDIEKNKLYDFFNGVKDIENQIIRTVSDKNIEEDPLRILRAAQFAARFGFNIEENTEREMLKFICLTEQLPKERVFIEIEKIVMKAEKASKAFYILKKLGWLKKVFPEVEILKNIEQGKKYHPEGDVFIHTMLALDFLPLEEREIDVMFAILFHDIGKAVVDNIIDGDNIHFYGHDKAGAEIVKEILFRITESKEITESVPKLIEYHMYPLQFQKGVTKKGIKKVAAKVDFEKLMKLHRADMGGKGISYDDGYIIKSIEIYREIKGEMKPIISGKDLIKIGVNPGILMGEYLRKIYEAQIEEEFNTYEEGMKYAEKILNNL